MAASIRSVSHPPAAQRDQRPDSFHQPEGPRSLQEPINRSQNTGHSKAQDPPPAPALEGIAHQHRGDGEESECGERIHVLNEPLGRAGSRVSTSRPLQRQGHSHAAADAECGQAELGFAAEKLVKKGNRDACPGTSDGMAQRNRPSIDV